MIIVNLPSRTLGLSFRHSDVDVIVPLTPKERKLFIPPHIRKTRGTYCEIYDVILNPEKGVKNAKWICEGSAVVGVGDQFRKAEGRKRALTRALNQLKPPVHGEMRSVSSIILGKHDRTKIWQVYHDRAKPLPTQDLP